MEDCPDKAAPQPSGTYQEPDSGAVIITELEDELGLWNAGERSQVIRHKVRAC